MKRHSRPHLFLRALTLAATLLFVGCATNTEVRNIVRASNYEMLVSADPALATTVPANPQSPEGQPAPDAASRLTAFLQANPDDKVMGSTLQLRQALLYLNHKDFSLADTAIKSVVATDLVTPRDLALVAAYAELRWWSEWAGAAEQAFKQQRSAAEAHMAALVAHADHKRLVATPDVRDYFLEMRAWIGLKLGLVVDMPADATFQKKTIEDAINTWTDRFTPQELTLVADGKFNIDQAFSLSTRRVLRLRTLLQSLATTVKSGIDQQIPAPALQFRSREAQGYYQAKLPPP